MTKREVFEKVKAHLLRQGKQAATEWGSCRYRTDDGLKCAVGCLFADEVYTGALEGMTVRVMRESPESSWSQCLLRALAAAGVSPDAMDLLEDLQDLHDAQDVETWRDNLDLLECVHFDEAA